MKQVKAFCAKWDMLPRGSLVLCAVSGGRDSMAMLHLLWSIAEKEGFRVAAAHFNHQLRPTADRDEAFVRSWCGERGIPLSCGSGDVKSFAREAGASLEDAARTLRYRFLEETAGRLGADRIATAHHREDHVETVLLHLLRGTGLQGLGGIPPVRGRIVRPLLETSRDDINSYISQYSIQYVEDETNLDTAFTRNHLRLEVVPRLEEIAPGFGARVARMAELLWQENEHLQREADGLLPESGRGEIILPAAVLNQQDLAMKRRLVRTMGQRLELELEKTQVDAVLALGSGGYLDLPGGLCAVRQPHRLILRRRALPPPPLELQPGDQDWGPWRVRLQVCPCPVKENARTVVLAKAPGALTIAAWDGGGRLAVENGSRTIKRLFADRGIPVERRGEHPALYLDGKPVAVFGVAADWGHRPQAGEPCLHIELLERGQEGGTQ